MQLIMYNALTVAYVMVKEAVTSTSPSRVMGQEEKAKARVT
jgi:hypothetical protein